MCAEFSVRVSEFKRPGLEELTVRERQQSDGKERFKSDQTACDRRLVYRLWTAGWVHAVDSSSNALGAYSTSYAPAFSSRITHIHT